MLGKFHKNTKSFNIIFSLLTFCLIGLLLLTSLYILVTTMLFKNNYVESGNHLSTILYYDYQTQTVSIVGIVLFLLVALSFISIIAYSISCYLFRPICLKKWPIVWTLGFLSFSIFVMFILTMLGHAWTTNENNNYPNVIVQSFLVFGKNNHMVQYGGASITVLLFDIVIYCCLIISITKIIINFINLSKNNYLVDQKEINE